MPATEPLLKTRQVAEALGMSVSTIKRWVDSGKLEAARTVGQHRMIPVSAALRFARAHGLPRANLEVLVGVGAAHLEAIDERVGDALVAALSEGRGGDARILIRSAYASGPGAVALGDALIRPALERIGHGWRAGALDVFQEHQATHVVAATLAGLVEEATRPGVGECPLAIGAAPEGDPYVLPGLLAELVLRDGGWAVRNLGVNLPLRSLANAAAHYRPRLVYLTVGHLPVPERFLREYQAFFKAATAVDAAVIVGGRALGPEVRAVMAFAGFGDRMAHLAEFARHLLPIGASPRGPSA